VREHARKGRIAQLFAWSTIAVLIASPAFAHTGVGETTGFVHGFMHPIGGLDHVLAMVAVGLFAALLGGRALWLVPLSFVTMMAMGGLLAARGIGLPFVELGIGLSVVAFGAAIAFRLNVSAAVAMAFVGFFAIFHGHAHGAEMPDTASGLEYGVGFLLATASLHVCGIGVGAALGMSGVPGTLQVARIAGAAIALAGVSILSGLI